MDAGIFAMGAFALFPLAVLLFGIGAVIWFAVKRTWWGNVFATRGNPDTASFTRSLAADGAAVYQTTPARTSKVGFVLAIIGLLLMFIPIIGIIPLLIGVVVLSIGSRHRAPATITVSETSLGTGANRWNLADIVALNIRTDSDLNTSDPTPYARWENGQWTINSQSTTVMFSKAFNRRAVERSYVITLTLRQGGAEAVLAGGLTPETAEALCNSLMEEIGKRSATART